ncbi:MAG: ABC transporter permease [Planctomycetes bacterium]|nr:ABC transporter permease [Planctomycetota bacterium]
MKTLRLVRNIRLGIKNLMLHKLRSLLTMLGMVFGVSSVIAMLSVGEGASQAAQEQIRKLGVNNIIISSVKPAAEDQQSSQGRMSIYGLKYMDAMRISETIPSVRRVVPVKLVRKTGRLGESSMELRVVGTTDEWFKVVRRPVLAGRKLNVYDIRNKAAVCVLTEVGARRLLAGRNTIGQSLQVGSDDFIVVGIVRSELAGEQTPDMQADIYIPISSCRERYGEIEIRQETGSRSLSLVELHKILIEAKSRAQVGPTATAVTAMLKRFHKKEDYRLQVPEALLRQAEATKRTFNIVLGSIAGISLLVGGIGIMNIMLASVTERTQEIGIRRAIGARRRQIVGQFLIETVVLSTVGGFIGIGLGVVFPRLVTYFADMPTVVTAYSISLSLGISLAVGLIFGIYPAFRAAMLDPIIALRHE